ncbi:hypothetical protein [Lysobacter olei]
MRSSVLLIAVLAASVASSLAWAEPSASGSSPAWAPASVQDAPAPAPAAEPAKREVAQDERTVCKVERTIGSNRTQRVCRSSEQIRREREAAREAMEKRGVCSTCGGDG